MMNLSGGFLVGALLSILVLSTNAQANTVDANQTAAQPVAKETKGQIAGGLTPESKASGLVVAEIRVPKKGYVRPEGNANPWAGGDTHEELRAFFGEK
jgi:hypothetical protein